MQIKPDPADYPGWLKILIVEGAIQRMEAPRQVCLSTKASLKLMNPKYRSYLDKAFRLAYPIFYYSSSNHSKKDYEELKRILIRMYTKETQ